MGVVCAGELYSIAVCSILSRLSTFKRLMGGLVFLGDVPCQGSEGNFWDGGSQIARSNIH